jgi:hypothetical protein
MLCRPAVMGMQVKAGGQVSNFGRYLKYFKPPVSL